MDSTRTRIFIPAVVAITLVFAPALTACSSPPQSTVDQGSGSATEPGNAVESTEPSVSQGSELPEGFPKDIPLVDGEVLSGGVITQPDKKVWNVSIRVNDVTVIDEITTQMEGAGFSSKTSSDDATQSTAGVYNKDVYNVLVVVYKDDTGGFTAIYTVTDKTPAS